VASYLVLEAEQDKKEYRQIEAVTWKLMEEDMRKKGQDSYKKNHSRFLVRRLYFPLFDFYL